jgi:hypothetical protein
MARLSKVFIYGAFALLYAWDVWEALGNLVGLGPFYEAMGIGQSMPWVLLWLGVALPVLVYLLAWWWGTKSSTLLDRVVIFLLGWAVVAAVTLTMASVEQAWRANALQGLAG